MGKMDTESKNYLLNPDIFADAFNYKLYDGRPVIRPESLQELDPTEIEVLEGKGVRVPVQRYRDSLKLWTVWKDEKAIYVIFGIESQTHVHYAMPVKDMLYDALNYAGQVEQIKKAHKSAEKDKKTPDDEDGLITLEADDQETKTRLTGDEFLSGLRKEDKLKPVITMVIYLGSKEWDGPLSIYDMLDIQDEEILRFIPDYKINLLTPAGVPDEDFEKFHTDFGKVLEYIKYSEDKEKIKQFQENPRFQEMDEDSVNFVNAVTKSKLTVKKSEGGKVNMCKGIEDLRAEERSIGKTEGRIEGRAEGRTEEAISLICCKIHKNKSLARIADDLEKSPEDIRPLYELVRDNIDRPVEEIYEILRESQAG